MPDDVILRSRAEIMRENLLAVQRVLSREAAARPPAVDRVVQIQAGLGTELNDVMSAITSIGNRLSNLQFRDDDSHLDERLEELRLSAESSAKEVGQIVERLREHLVAVKLLRDTGLRALTDNRNDIKVQIHTRAGELSALVAATNYVDVRKDAEGVLEAYAELLLGAALRSPRFGHDDAMPELFDIADALPRLWPQPNNWQWSALTVPSGREGPGVSPANLLRMAYPEWTVWALPLLHVQFSRIYLTRIDAAVYGEFAKSPGAADALATAFAGPACVLAALLFRVDPAAVTTSPARLSDAPLDAAVRSATALRTLRVIADVEPSPLDTLCTRLVDAWRLAIQTAGGQVEAFDQHFNDPETEACARDAWALAVNFRPGAPIRLPPWAGNWATVSGWAAELAEGTEPDLDAFPSAGPLDAIVPLMNAMWLARVGVRAEDDAPADTIAALGTRAASLLLDIVRGAAPAPRGAQRPWGGR